ncbi:helix-turn-helix domain-containing protein [Staphylococcus pasteuri]|uniref:helix-turn-helix domain-containing protein n=1 Tax=Staphylococcus pasteuri TaxID=45972 RepID=UPI003CFF2196
MNEFGNKLKELRGEKSIRETSKNIGISHTYLDSLEKGYDPRTGKERKPTIEVINKISKYYNYDLFELLNLSGLLPSLSELPNTPREVQKKVLSNMIENISNENETVIKHNYINLLNNKLGFDEIQYLKHTYNFLITEMNDANENDYYSTDFIIKLGQLISNLYHNKNSQNNEYYQEILNDFDKFLKEYINIK